MEVLRNIFMFSFYVGFQITTFSKLQITKMTCKGPFSFMNFPYVSFHFTAVQEHFPNWGNLANGSYFPFMDFLDMFLHIIYIIKAGVCLSLLECSNAN